MDMEWLAWRWLFGRTCRGVLGVALALVLMFNLLGVRHWLTALLLERALQRVEWISDSISHQPGA